MKIKQLKKLIMKKSYQCKKCGENIGWIGRFVFGGFFHNCHEHKWDKYYTNFIDFNYFKCKECKGQLYVEKRITDVKGESSMLPMIEIHAPAVTHILEVINKPVMVYDSKGNLINASNMIRSGISSSDHATTFTVWFDDGSHKYHLERLFVSKQEAEDFLNSIYNIKE